MWWTNLLWGFWNGLTAWIVRLWPDGRPLFSRRRCCQGTGHALSQSPEHRQAG